jgi:hypothetical protein
VLTLHIQDLEAETMKVTVENGELVIRIEMATNPAPSASGKTLVLASSHGNVQTAATFQGKPITVGLNAYVKR